MPLVTAAVTCTITRSRPRPVLATPVAAATAGTLVGGFLPSPAVMAACVDVGVVTRSTVAAPVAMMLVRVAVTIAAALAAVAMARLLVLVLAPSVLVLVLALMSMLVFVLVFVLVALPCCVAPPVGGVITARGNGFVQPKLWDVEPTASARQLHVAHGQLHCTWPIRSSTHRCRVQQPRQISGGGGTAAVPTVSVTMLVPPTPVAPVAVCAAVAIAASIVSCVALRDDGCRHATPTGATTPATHHQVPPVEEGEEHSN